MWRFTTILLLVAALSYPTTCLPVLEDELDTSTRLLGSSVVTSVSVVTGKVETSHNSRKVPPVASNQAKEPGKDPTKKDEPVGGAQKLPASPADLLRPDRFQFYTYNNLGHVVKTQMTDQQIQSLIATGGNGIAHLPIEIHESQSVQDLSSANEGPKVADVVQNVQNVLKGELNKPTTLLNAVPTIPAQASVEWSNLLPTILAGESADTVPVDSSVPEEAKPTTEKAQIQNSTVAGVTSKPEIVYDEKPMIPVQVITAGEKVYDKVTTSSAPIEDTPVLFQILSTISPETADSLATKSPDTVPTTTERVFGSSFSSSSESTISGSSFAPVSSEEPILEKLPSIKPPVKEETKTGTTLAPVSSTTEADPEEKPLEKLPVDLEDSLSSMLSQISQTVPSLIPLNTDRPDSGDVLTTMVPEELELEKNTRMPEEKLEEAFTTEEAKELSTVKDGLMEDQSSSSGQTESVFTTWNEETTVSGMELLKENDTLKEKEESTNLGVTGSNFTAEPVLESVTGVKEEAAVKEAVTTESLPTEGNAPSETPNTITSLTNSITEKTLLGANNDSVTEPTSSDAGTDLPAVKVSQTDAVSTINAMINEAPVQNSTPTIEPLTLPENVHPSSAGNLASGLIAGFTSTEAAPAAAGAQSDAKLAENVDSAAQNDTKLAEEASTSPGTEVPVEGSKNVSDASVSAGENSTQLQEETGTTRAPETGTVPDLESTTIESGPKVDEKLTTEGPKDDTVTERIEDTTKSGPETTTFESETVQMPLKIQLTDLPIIGVLKNEENLEAVPEIPVKPTPPAPVALNSSKDEVQQIRIRVNDTAVLVSTKYPENSERPQLSGVPEAPGEEKPQVLEEKREEEKIPQEIPIGNVTADAGEKPVGEEKVMEENPKVEEASRVPATEEQKPAAMEQKMENSKLNLENSKLSLENSKLNLENSKLNLENSKLNMENSKLTLENSKLNTENTKLTSENSALSLESPKPPLEANTSASTLEDSSVSFKPVSENITVASKNPEISISTTEKLAPSTESSKLAPETQPPVKLPEKIEEPGKLATSNPPEKAPVAEKPAVTAKPSEIPAKKKDDLEVPLEKLPATTSKPIQVKLDDDEKKPLPESSHATRKNATTKLEDKGTANKPEPSKPTKLPSPNNKKTDAPAGSLEEKWTLIPQQQATDPVAPTNTKIRRKPELSTPAPVVGGQLDEQTTVQKVPLEVSQTAKGLDSSVLAVDSDIRYFVDLCNDLAFNFWSSTNKGLSTTRSLALSPFGMISMLAMVFLGARGPTSDQMNGVLKLDDVATFNPHLVFQNVTDAVSLSQRQGIANAAFVRELFADRIKVRRLLPFYKEQAQKFYDGFVEEVNFATISDIVRRRTTLLIRKQTGGRIKDFVKTNTVPLRSPLAALSANVFQTDCNSSAASSQGRDGELYFAVSPAIRQRKLVPVPATVWRSGVLAGYEPSLDATAVALGGAEKLVSTIFLIPGQQGNAAPGDTLDRLEQRLVRSSFKDGSWNKLLKVLIPRSGLELQVPKFSHRSVINATAALKRMGLEELFSRHADLRGINGVGHDLHLADVLQMNLFSTCGDENIVTGRHHVEIYPASPTRNVRSEEFEDIEEKPAFENVRWMENREDNLWERLRSGRQSESGLKPRLRLDRPFLYFVRHNPTGLILHMGRFNPRLLP